MKLLYLWINCSENGFINKQGFNIAGDKFWEYDEGNKALSSKNKDGYIKNFWDENNMIEDLTAIVGSNGSGKSTLLSEIMRYGIIVPHELHGEIDSQGELRRRECEKKIVVYEEDGHIYYDHNLEYEIYTCPVMVRKKMDVLRDCTKLFVSNSINNPVKLALYQGENVLDFALTDYTMRDQAKVIIRKNRIPDYVYPSKENDNSRYYDSPDEHRSEESYIRRARELNGNIVIDENAFEDLNALIRLFFLIRSKCKTYSGKTFKYVTIKMKKQSEILVAERDKAKVFNPPVDYVWSEVTALNNKNPNTLFDTLARYFFYEYLCYYKKGIPESLQEISVEQLKKVCEFVQNHIYRNLEDSLQENMTTSEYLLNAAQDVILFEKVLAENKMIYSENDSCHSYIEGVQVDLSNNQSFFDRLLMFFERGIPSIFIRYLTFEFEGLSSGEEAMLNLYSRIFWLYNAQGCKKESLILIDELDLYMHPKWQKELVSYLVEDIQQLIGADNRVQIIITTHSPIILSDVPKANIIFLKNRDGKCVISNNNHHRATFGNNVHTLFLDSFFLDDDGTMGAFAERKINRLIKKLMLEEITDDEAPIIFNMISIIGDELIRSKLLDLYNQRKSVSEYISREKNETEMSAIDTSIAVLKEQLQNIKNAIVDLEKLKK